MTCCSILGIFLFSRPHWYKPQSQVSGHRAPWCDSGGGSGGSKSIWKSSLAAAALLYNHNDHFSFWQQEQTFCIDTAISHNDMMKDILCVKIEDDDNDIILWWQFITTWHQGVASTLHCTVATVQGRTVCSMVLGEICRLWAELRCETHVSVVKMWVSMGDLSLQENICLTSVRKCSNRFVDSWHELCSSTFINIKYSWEAKQANESSIKRHIKLFLTELNHSTSSEHCIFSFNL